MRSTDNDTPLPGQPERLAHPDLCTRLGKLFCCWRKLEKRSKSAGLSEKKQHHSTYRLGLIAPSPGSGWWGYVWIWTSIATAWNKSSKLTGMDEDDAKSEARLKRANRLLLKRCSHLHSLVYGRESPSNPEPTGNGEICMRGNKKTTLERSSNKPMGYLLVCSQNSSGGSQTLEIYQILRLSKNALWMSSITEEPSHWGGGHTQL